MALTLVGRYQLQHEPVAPVQDPNDFDSMYFLMNDGGGYKLYKFTWPDTLAAVSAVISFSATPVQAAIMDGDFAWGIGYKDTTRRYGLFTMPTTGAGNAQFTQINLETGAVVQTSYGSYNDYGNLVSYGIRMYCGVGYDGTGSYFYCTVPQYKILKVYADGVGGSAITAGASAYNIPVVTEDDQTFIEQQQDAGWQRFTHTGVGATSVLPDSYLPGNFDGCTVAKPSYLRNNLGGMVRKQAYWTDGWRYIFAMGVRDDEGFDLYFIRKNVNTGQYDSVKIGDTQATAGSQVVLDALDIWEAGGVRKLFFARGIDTTPTVYATAWPPVITDSVQVDNAGNVISLHTNEEFIYGFCTSGDGDTYSPQIFKLMDSDLVTGSATPSISAPGAVLLWKDKRLFFIGVEDYERYLWWSAPYEPQALDPGWDGYNTTVFDDENNVSLISLEDCVYIGSKKGWMRLRGKTPDHWVLDRTMATMGPLNNKSVAVTPFGAIYPRADGLYIFNGYTARLFFEKGKGLMENVNFDEIDKIFSLWDGRYYRLFYPSGSGTTNDRELIVDMIAGVDNARATEGDRAASAGWADIPTGTIYLADESGNVYTEGGGSATRSLEITTKEYPAQGLVMSGQFSKLHYDIDCAGASVYVTPIYDGVAQTAILIPSNTSRTRKHILLPKGNAYRVGIKITVSTDQAVKIYEPWILE